MEQLFFPIFISLSGKKIMMFGGGRIASRRVAVLLDFGAQITVVAPRISTALVQLAERGRLRILNECYREGMLEGCDMVFSAIDDRDVDQAIHQECKTKGIPVNIAADRTLCDFYFPGLIREEDIVVGVSAGGRNHKKVKRVTSFLRQMLKQATAGPEEEREWG